MAVVALYYICWIHIQYIPAIHHRIMPAVMVSYNKYSILYTT